MKSNFFDIKLLKFIFVGVINTLFSAIIMFLLYNLLHLGYWGASSIAYILASILSFILNKSFTFKNKDSILKTAFKFSVNVAICYLLAFSISKPLIILFLSNFEFPSSVIDQASMLFGMVIFTLLNYVGQRFFAFKENNGTTPNKK